MSIYFNSFWFICLFLSIRNNRIFGFMYICVLANVWYYGCRIFYCFCNMCNCMPTGGRENSVGIATRYGLDGSGGQIPVWAIFSVPFQTGLGASCTLDTGSFPGKKRPWLVADHPPPSSAEDASGLELYLRLHSVPAYAGNEMTFLHVLQLPHHRHLKGAALC